MKIKQDDLNYLKSILPDAHALGDAVTRYNAGDFIRADHVKSLRTRFVWDVFYYLRNRVNHADFFDSLNKYLNDNHIETALKHVLKAQIDNLNKSDLPKITKY